MSNSANNDLSTFTFNPVNTDHWWASRSPDQGSLGNYSTQGDLTLSPLNLGLAAESFGATALVAYDICLGLPVARGLAKQAWRIRRLEARRFQVPLMQVSWRRCLYLAAISSYQKKGWNLRLYRAIHQDLARTVAWC